MKFFTLGVYNSTEESFFSKLVDNNIDTFCDIRQRRGVRGAKYAYVNSNRLQTKLMELDVKYGHELALAPSTQVRDLQKEHDAKSGVYKQTRSELGSVFKTAYTSEILSRFDFKQFIERLDMAGASNVALFCVEEQPKACHRSIVANTLISMGYTVVDI
jgi:uncharacterized protein (DUF488 family)